MFVNPRISKGLLSVDWPSFDCLPPSTIQRVRLSWLFFCSNTIFLEKNPGVFFIFFIQSQVSAAWAASPVLILHPTFRWQCKPQTLPPPNVFVRKVSELKLDKIAKCFHSDNPGLFISINQNRIFLLLTQYISAPPCLFPRPDKYISGDTVLR